MAFLKESFSVVVAAAELEPPVFDDDGGGGVCKVEWVDASRRRRLRAKAAQ